jgi:nicotinamide-nucleotide amidase
MRTIYAEVLSIGDEILYGQITDTNSQWISAELDKIGVRTIRKTTVGDDEKQILQAFQEAERRADMVLITGGLGPTSDDLTKPLLARYFDSPISTNEQALAELEEMYRYRNRPLNALNRRQADLPEKCQFISNKVGTAPGMWFEREGKVFVSMPGVPHEMKKMMSEIILPKLERFFNPPAIYHRMVRTSGIAESVLAETLSEWEAQLPPHIKLAYLPKLMQVRLRLTAFGEDREQLKQEVEKEIEKLPPSVGKYIYGYDEDLLEEVIGRILREREETVSTAESCTGGHIAHTITSIAGSSDYFLGGIIPYQNEIKVEQLGVKVDTIAHYGAVSEECVKEMARNVREKFRTTYGLASSGIAGPGGGTPDKPVGTVWIALSDGVQTVAKKLALSKDRAINIQLTTVAVLNLLFQTLREKS